MVRPLTVFRNSHQANFTRFWSISDFSVEHFVLSPLQSKTTRNNEQAKLIDEAIVVLFRAFDPSGRYHCTPVRSAQCTKLSLSMDPGCAKTTLQSRAGIHCSWNVSTVDWVTVDFTSVNQHEQESTTTASQCTLSTLVGLYG